MIRKSRRFWKDALDLRKQLDLAARASFAFYGLGTMPLNRALFRMSRYVTEDEESAIRAYPLVRDFMREHEGGKTGLFPYLRVVEVAKSEEVALARMVNDDASITGWLRWPPTSETLPSTRLCPGNSDEGRLKRQPALLPEK